jgi:hypothetical protein
MVILIEREFRVPPSGDDYEKLVLENGVRAKKS